MEQNLFEYYMDHFWYNYFGMTAELESVMTKNLSKYEFLMSIIAVEN